MRGSKALAACYAGIAAASLWLRWATPLNVIGYAMHDDLLFVRLAHRLVAGQWLGAFDNLILMKGIGYPLFIAAAYATGLPLKVAEQAVYLAAVGALARVVFRLTRSRTLALVLFAGLAFNPVLWTTELSRVIREGLYIGLGVAIFALAAMVLLLRHDPPRPVVRRAAILLALGFLCGVYWITREERIWFIPVIAALIVGAGLQA